MLINLLAFIISGVFVVLFLYFSFKLLNKAFKREIDEYFFRLEKVIHESVCDAIVASLSDYEVQIINCEDDELCK